MKRLLAFAALIIGFPIMIVFMVRAPVSWVSISIVVIILTIALYDIFQKKHTVLRNFPVVGHLRYIFEMIRPEIRQYFIAGNLEGRPYNREVRSLVYQRAKQTIDNLPFGSEQDINKEGYEWIEHSLVPQKALVEEARVLMGNAACLQPYSASRLNISAMSFGALSSNALRALNQGAKLGNFALNTGEGGLSPYHLEGGGDLIIQLGTANFGYRNSQGKFSPELFIEKSRLPQVKMIELKLSQGAKPGHGGILPGAKVTAEIAAIRSIAVGETVVSPPAHESFSTPIGLLQHLQLLRELSQGKPVGFKLCVGRRHEFMAIVKAMIATNIYPDFITVDGSEGGTGAAPVEYIDYVGTPLHDGLIFVHNCLVGTRIRDKIRLIASGKIATGFDMITKLALGADACQAARAFMFSIGCIQAKQCHNNTCPTGIATQDPRLIRGLDVADKAKRCYHYHHATVDSFLELLGVMGAKQVSELDPSRILYRLSERRVTHYKNLYQYLQPGELLQGSPQYYAEEWQRANAETFL